MPNNDSTFESLSREDLRNLIAEVLAPALKKDPPVPQVKLHPIKSEGNRRQYEFCVENKTKILTAIAQIEAGNSAEAIVALKEAVEITDKRIKHIRIADGCAGGWDTVAEYEKHEDLADNSADEKKIRAADNNAVKSRQKGKMFTNQRKGPTFQPSRSTYSKPTRPYTKNFRPSRQPGASQQPGPSQLPGPCFRCGLEGHWRRFCPQDDRSSGRSQAGEEFQ